MCITNGEGNPRSPSILLQNNISGKLFLTFVDMSRNYDMENVHPIYSSIVYIESFMLLYEFDLMFLKIIIREMI